MKLARLLLVCASFSTIMALDNLDFDDFKAERIARITGADLKIPGKRCVYYEWVIGTIDNGEFSTYQIGFKSDEPVHLSISGRGMDVPVSKLRPYLEPFAKHSVLKPEDAPAQFRESVKEFVLEHGESVLAEYCIESGRAYHVMLHIDEYLLPPRGPGGPERRTNKVLYLADSAFSGGRPPAPLTPAYRGWTY